MKRDTLFLKLLEAEKEALLKELIHKTYNRDDALDLFQETICIAFEHFDELRNPKAFSSWLRTCARTAISEKYRRKMSQEIPIDLAAGQVDESRFLFNDGEQEDVLDTVIQKLDLQELRTKISELNFTSRVFIYFRYEKEMSFKEIANELDTTPEYLAVLHSRLKDKLRKWKQVSDEQRNT